MCAEPVSQHGETMEEKNEGVGETIGDVGDGWSDVFIYYMGWRVVGDEEVD